jgi:hypothetical protein
MLYNSWVQRQNLVATQALAAGKQVEAMTLRQSTVAWLANNAAMLGWMAGIVVVIAAIVKLNGPMLAMAAVVTAAAAAWIYFWAAASGPASPVVIGLIAASAAMGIAAAYKMNKEAAATADLNANWGGPGGAGSPGLTVGGTTSIGGMTDIAGGFTPSAGMTAGSGRTSSTHIEIHGDVYDREGFKKVLNEAFQDMDDSGEL